MLRCVRLWTGSDDASQVQLGRNDDLVSAVMSATHVTVEETAGGGSLAWHTAPVRQLVVTLAGTLNFSTRDGERFTLRPGDHWTNITVALIAREVPLVMGPDDLYAIPAMFGAATYVTIDFFWAQWVAVAVGSAVATLLRLAALAFHWRLPTGPRDLIQPYDQLMPSH
jgi:hypothetical protein